MQSDRHHHPVAAFPLRAMSEVVRFVVLVVAGASLAPPLAPQTWTPPTHPREQPRPSSICLPMCSRRMPCERLGSVKWLHDVAEAIPCLQSGFHAVGLVLRRQPRSAILLLAPQGDHLDKDAVLLWNGCIRAGVVATCPMTMWQGSLVCFQTGSAPPHRGSKLALLHIKQNKDFI